MATTVAITSTGWADTAPISPQMSQPLVAASLASAPVEAANYRSWTVVAGGTYALHIPANSGIVLSIDGKQVAAATGARLADAGEMITALLTLEAGDHVVTITGVSAENAAIGAITVNLVGSPAQPLIAVSTALDAGAVAELQAAGVVPANAAKAGEIQSAATSGASPFAIGGGSSRSESPSSAANASNPALMRTASAPAATAAASRVPAPTSGTSILSGGIRRPQTPSTPASGGGSGASDRMPSASGGSTGGRRLTGHGGPRSDRQPLNPSGPVIPPALDTIQTSPLSPPKNVTLTQAIELTWAGNSAGQVANTGTTLFGGVMDPMQYDLINVTIAPGGRTTTVDVGAVTGQFAVRLFPEDFAAGAVVTVSLVGGSSVDANVASMPVSYTVTGVAPVDGITQAMSRLTFGPSPELYARLRGIGYAAFVEEQLNPETIPDGRFNMMNAGSLLNRTTTNGGEMLNSIIHHDIAYSAFSQKQLREVMSQFWANHFYAANKDSGIVVQAIDDRNFFRANALGNFEDMLLYSARSPLMSQYLDNDQNRKEFINENYGREILELSTVGVDAGYTDEDIIASSRIFTGWRYERTNPNTDGVPQTYEFYFDSQRHDTDPKVIPVLGINIQGRSGEAGVQEGEEYIAILAQHPSTRNFVCGKIVTLLVADTPPVQFVQSCAAAWEASGGEVKEMLRAILLDPAYIQNVELQRNKAKTPLEMSISTIRAFGAAPRTGDEQNFYSRFRQPITTAGYNYVSDEVPPTGLPEVSAAWLNSAAMIATGNRLADAAERRDELGIDLVADGTDAGLETAEEFAAYLLTVATADRFTREEYEALVADLKGTDGIFDPRNGDERRALERAMGLVLVTPSFAIQ